MSMTPEPRYAIVVLLDADYIDGRDAAGAGAAALPAAPATASTTSSPSCRRDRTAPRLSLGRRTSRPRPDATADAKVDLFQVRVQDFEPLAAEVSRFTTFTTTLGRQPRATERAPGRSSARRVVTPQPGIDHHVRDGADVDHHAAAGDRRSPSSTFVAAGAGAAGRAHASTRTRRRHVAPAREASVGLARAGGQRGATTQPDRQHRASSACSASASASSCSRRGARRTWRGSSSNSSPTVSHELRTPLAVIRSAADNLADGVVARRGADPPVRRAGAARGRAPDRYGRADSRVRRPPVGPADADAAAGGGGARAARRRGGVRSR